MDVSQPPDGYPSAPPSLKGETLKIPVAPASDRGAHERLRKPQRGDPFKAQGEGTL